MKLVIVSWRGVDINDGDNFIADFPDGQPLVNPASLLTVDMLNRPAKGVGRRLTPAYVTFLVQPQGDYRTQREELRQLFQTEEEYTYYPLVAIDEDDGDRPWTINLAVISVSQKDDAFIILTTPDEPYWEADAINQEELFYSSFDINEYEVLTPEPHIVRPVITLTPFASPTGTFLYERWVMIKSPGMPGIVPFDFGGGLNTAALVAAGKARSDGYDVRLLINGSETPRWFGNYNTSATKIWANIQFPAILPIPLGATIASSGAVTTITLLNNEGNRTAFAAWPSSGEIVVDNEGYIYSAKNDALLQLTIVARAIKGTSMAAHSLGTLVYYQPYDVRIIYGNAAATNPNYTFDKLGSMPLINLNSSTNTSWVIDYFGQYHQVSGRPIWGRYMVKWEQTAQTFTGPAITQTDPWQVWGAYFSPRYYNGEWLPVSNGFNILLNSPWRINGFSAAGRKFNQNGGVWLSVKLYTILVSDEVTGRVDRYTIPAPSVANTIETWSYTYPGGGNFFKVGFEIQGTAPAISDYFIWAEVNDFSVTFESFDVPTVSLAPESDTYVYEMTVTNLTTGSVITISKTTPGFVPLIIDTRQHRVLVNGLDSSAGVVPSDNNNWFWLASGVNEIQVVATGITGMSIRMQGTAERNV